DANASCANPDSNVSQAIYVPLTITGGLTGDMTDLVVTQDIAYYNFAVKNAAFRIWYFVDSNESLIQNWTATTSDTTRRNLTGISGLYNNSAYPLCASSCTTPTSTTCFSCIRANYARPLCSRDNFAVRPEAYDIHIFDINQSLLQTDPLKDSTKIKLADSIVTANRLKVAAGYNYRYDMNATGNDDLQKVPGYTRYFNGANSDYNATLVWEPTTIKTGCNDTAGKTLSFYIANGQMTNAEQNLTQVGEYRLSVVDPAWTAVDWLYLNHHSVASGFSTGEDCIVNNTTTDPTTDPSALKRIGCLTSSSHTGGGYTYTDHLMTFKPAKFDLSAITYGIGILPTSIAAGGSGYVYTSNLGAVNDMGMSVRSYGAVKAEGYSGETLSNFVKDCYASDLNVTISHDANNSYAPFVGRMTVSDLNGTQLYDSLEFNAKSAVSMTIDDSNFTKADMGTTVPTIRLNFDRNVTTPLEPQIVHYDDLNVSCLIASDCNMSAAYNITPNTAFSSDAMDFNVTHIYGRLIPRDTKVMGLIPFDVVAKYEAYKTPMLLGNALAADSFQADWNVNALHTEANYGNADISFVLPTAGSVLPSTTIYDNNGTVTYHFNAYSIRQGYKGHINTGGWLWYGGTSALDYVIPSNPSNVDCLTHPCFNISFGRIIGNTGSAKTESEAQKANKNTSSGTGWHSTSEYAPATR
ncbi:hypothetical protein, partial [Sulfuricurvum sp.]|uniref:hypothetical protein n=1 Tax=Sulfuricurvum sp. TaxID=2025608 RepID=UPI0026113AC7